MARRSSPPVAKCPEWLAEFDAEQRARRYPDIEPVASGLADDLSSLLADYWQRVDAEIREAEAERRAVDVAKREALARAEAEADRTEARRLRRRQRVFGVRAILEIADGP